MKSAYRRVIKLWHPDRFPSDSASYSEAIRRTQRINAAYRLLEWDDSSQELQQSDAQAPSVPVWNRPVDSVHEVILIVLSVSVVVVGLVFAIAELVSAALAGLAWAISVLFG